MNVLSLFDGMSCGMIALERAGIAVDNYYSSEIDKYAIKVSEVNYPNIIRLGDVTKWQDWDIDWNIDLLLFGAPCQSYSLAGNRGGIVAHVAQDCRRRAGDDGAGGRRVADGALAFLAKL